MGSSTTMMFAGFDFVIVADNAKTHAPRPVVKATVMPSRPSIALPPAPPLNTSRWSSSCSPNTATGVPDSPPRITRSRRTQDPAAAPRRSSDPIVSTTADRSNNKENTDYTTSSIKKINSPPALPFRSPQRDSSFTEDRECFRAFKASLNDLSSHSTSSHSSSHTQPSMPPLLPPECKFDEVAKNPRPSSLAPRLPPRTMSGGNL